MKLLKELLEINGTLSKDAPLLENTGPSLAMLADIDAMINFLLIGDASIYDIENSSLTGFTVTVEYNLANNDEVKAMRRKIASEVKKHKTIMKITSEKETLGYENLVYYYFTFAENPETPADELKWYRTIIHHVEEQFTKKPKTSKITQIKIPSRGSRFNENMAGSNAKQTHIIEY